MRRIVQNAAFTLLLALGCSIGAARADAPPIPEPVPAPKLAQIPAPPQVLKITKGGESNVSQALRLPLNKAAIIELPVDARDVLVTNPGIVDAVIKTPRRSFVLGTGVGETNAFFFDAAGRQILNLEIEVTREIRGLSDMISKLVPTSKVDLAAVNDSIIVSGTVPNASQAEQVRQIAERFVGDPTKVVNLLQIAGRDQVMLKVRVVEMQRTVAKQLGVDLEAVIQGGDFFIDLVTENPFSLVGRALSDTEIRPGFISGDDGITATIRALERNGLVRTLAEPNLTAISGEAANFLAGGEFPFPVGQDSEGRITFEFRPVGVGLAFTPVVLSEGKISLRISTEVSEITSENSFVLSGTPIVDSATGQVTLVPGLTVPGLRVRRTETTVEMPSGGSIMIAGLIQDDLKQNIDGIPFLKDLPILGQLFRSRDFSRNETELVVLVTPYTVKPINQAKLQTPIDGLAVASDLETILFGRLNAVYGIEAAASRTRAGGRIGYIVE